MKKLNEKGFTLIELLAVIIILGVLLLIAIPAMTGIIEGAKKDSWISTAKNYISQVRYMALQGDISLPGKNQWVPVLIKDRPNGTSRISLEQGNANNSVYNSPWQEYRTCVVIANVPENNGEDKYIYYFYGVDNENNCQGLTQESELDRNDVQRRNNANCTLTCNALTVPNATYIGGYANS